MFAHRCTRSVPTSIESFRLHHHFRARFRLWLRAIMHLSPPRGGTGIVTSAATLALTIVPTSVTFDEFRSLKGRQPVTPADAAGAVPAGGGSSPPLPGGSGELRPAGTMTGLRGNPLDWDRKERVTPAVTHERAGFPDHALQSVRSFEPSGPCARPSPRKRVSGAELWRSLAAASAVVERRQASALRFQRAPRPLPTLPRKRGRGKEDKARRIGNTFVGVPLPFICRKRVAKKLFRSLICETGCNGSLRICFVASYLLLVGIARARTKTRREKEEACLFPVILRRPRSGPRRATARAPRPASFEARGACHRAGHFGPDPLARTSG